MMRLTWLNMAWRTGRRNKRNLYVQVGPEPDGDSDICIGLVDSPSLAERIVADHNASLAGGPREHALKDLDEPC